MSQDVLAEAPPGIFWSRYLSQVWVKSHLSESNLSKKGPPKCAYSRHILFCDKSAMLFHKSMEKKNSDNPFLTLSCSYLFHSMKGLITVSRAFVFQNEGIQPFLSQINTFGKWLRLSAKSLLSKTEKTQISEQTQIIWVRWSLWFPDDIFSRADIFKLGAEILVRFCYLLHSHARLTIWIREKVTPIVKTI